jgi:cytochrome c peroxidase
MKSRAFQGAGLALGALLLVATLTYCFAPAKRATLNVPLGLPPLAEALDRDLTTDRIALGHKLFFDRRLSFNGTMSCAMCHVPEEGFTSQASKRAVGIEGKSLRRNAPGLLNVAFQQRLFHDGRESALATQAWLPLLHADEMANPSIGYVLDQLHTLPDYAGTFERAFNGASASMETVGRAIAAYEATLLAGNSRFDRFQYARVATALTAQEQQGLQLFTGKARCAQCHSIGAQDALFTDHGFHVTGAGLSTPKTFTVPLAPGVETVLAEADLAAFAQAEPPDLGRFEITHRAADRYAFRTPTLRNVAHTAPYMHDGSLASLQEVIAFYDRGGGNAPGKSPLLTPLGLSADDKLALLSFLRSLDAQDLPAIVQKSRTPQ